MLICASCHFTNPDDHNFCQRCGEPLSIATRVPSPSEAPEQLTSERPALERPTEHLPESSSQPFSEQLPLRVYLMPPDKLELVPDDYLPVAETATSEQRYQILTVLNQGCANVIDTQPAMRSPLQKELATLAGKDLDTFKTYPQLPAAAYPYLLLGEAAPTLYDCWQQGETALLITAEQPSVSPLLKAFSNAVDPLQYVYWMYTLTDLWAALAPIPQWRSSLLQADNLGIDTDQSLRIQRFIRPTIQPPQLSGLQAFLKSLLAQPHRGQLADPRQVRQLTLSVTSAQTLEQLRSELEGIGKALLSTPAAITPIKSADYRTSGAASESASGPDLPSFTTSDAMQTDASTHAADPEDFWASTEDPIIENIRAENIETDTLKTDDIEPQNIGFDTLPENDIDSEDPLLLEAVLLDADALSEPGENSDATMVLPMKLVALEDAGQTDVGRQRDHNEDCFSIVNSLKKSADNSGQKTHAHCLYVLCDGMGGHEGGEVASQLAAQTLTQYFEEHWPVPVTYGTGTGLPNESTIIEAVKLANQAIFEVNEEEQRAGHERMGTTLVMVLLQGTSAIVAHVGDSRLYQHTRRLGLRQITVDHEVGQREIQRGVDPETAYARPDAYQLTQALGPRDSADLVPSVSYLNFSEDTLLLLCSDGLSDNDLVEDYLDTHIDPILRSKKSLDLGVDELIQLSNEVNGHDNITAIAVRLKVSPDIKNIRG
ncbi:MAG: serine/threonine phosphatase [Cyanobacteria bacterium J06632_3]